MKAFFILLAIIAIVLAIVLMKPAPAAKKHAVSAPEPTTQSVQKPHSAAAQPQPPPPQSSVSEQPSRVERATGAAGVVSEVNSVINYGMGATQLKAKKNATQKIRDINRKHNEDLERELNHK